MEKIYKPETEDAGKVEVYSRENNDMLGDMPQWLIHTGSYIVYGLIVFLVAGTALFKYPDTIRKPSPLMIWVVWNGLPPIREE